MSSDHAIGVALDTYATSPRTDTDRGTAIRRIVDITQHLITLEQIENRLYSLSSRALTDLIDLADGIINARTQHGIEDNR